MSRIRGGSSFSVRYGANAQPHVVVDGKDLSIDVLELHIHEKPGDFRTATITVLLDNETVHEGG